MTTEERLAQTKAAQRRQGIAARRAISPEARRAADAAICARIASLPAWQAARRVLAYAAFGGEPDLAALLEGCGKQTAYPVCGQGFTLTAALPAPVDGWEVGAYGIRTPVLARAETLPPETLDLVLAPCTAFDERSTASPTRRRKWTPLRPGRWTSAWTGSSLRGGSTHGNDAQNLRRIFG